MLYYLLISIRLLPSSSQDLKESFNYGLFCPPSNGKAGKFLDEERRLGDYPFSGPVGYLEVNIEIGQQLHTIGQIIIKSPDLAAKVQATCLQDAKLGREAAEGVAHARQFASLSGVREQRPGREGLEDVHEGSRPELPLPGDERDAVDDCGGGEEAK